MVVMNVSCHTVEVSWHITVFFRAVFLLYILSLHRVPTEKRHVCIVIHYIEIRLHCAIALTLIVWPLFCTLVVWRYRGYETLRYETSGVNVLNSVLSG